MKITMVTAALFGATMLGACGASETSNTTATSNANAAEPTAVASPTSVNAPANPSAVRIAGDGLSVGGKRVTFGTPRAAALAEIGAGMGGAPDSQGTQEECGPGPLGYASWNKGLQVYFQDDKLVGWSGAVDLKTAEGIGFGSTRSAVETAYHPTIEATSLGTEFTTKDGLSGTFESDAKDASVSDVWAGMTCLAR